MYQAKDLTQAAWLWIVVTLLGFGALGYALHYVKKQLRLTRIARAIMEDHGDLVAMVLSNDDTKGRGATVGVVFRSGPPVPNTLMLTLATKYIYPGRSRSELILDGIYGVEYAVPKPPEKPADAEEKTHSA